MHNFHRIRDFHAFRASGVGSSDIATLAGLNIKYGDTPVQLWRVKTGRDAPWEGNAATAWGRQLEGLVLKEHVSRIRDKDTAEDFYRSYLRQRSTGEMKVYTEARHPQYKFAIAHADLLIEGDYARAEMDGHQVKYASSIVEAKTHSWAAARRDEDPDFGYSSTDFSQNGIPMSVFLQVQWQLFVYGIERGHVAALINTNDYREFGPIIADPRTQEKELALAERFMWHVRHDEPPEPRTWSDVQSLFPTPTETTAMVGGDEEMAARQMVEQWHKAGKAMGRLEARRADIKNALGLLIGANKVLAAADGVKLASSWEQANPPSVDWARIKAEYPKLYADLVEAGIVRHTTRRELRPAKLRGGEA